MTIQSLTGLIALLALSLGAMRYGSELVVQITMTLVVVVLLVGLTHAIVRRKGSSIGLVVFALGYWISYIVLTVALSGGSNGSDLPHLAIAQISKALHPIGVAFPPRPNVSAVLMKNLLAGRTEDWFKEDNYGNLARFDFDSNLAPNSTEHAVLSEFQRKVKEYADRRQGAEERQSYAEVTGLLCFTFLLGGAGTAVGSLIEKRCDKTAQRSASPLPHSDRNSLSKLLD